MGGTDIIRRGYQRVCKFNKDVSNCLSGPSAIPDVPLPFPTFPISAPSRGASRARSIKKGEQGELPSLVAASIAIPIKVWVSSFQTLPRFIPLPSKGICCVSLLLSACFSSFLKFCLAGRSSLVVTLSLCCGRCVSESRHTDCRHGGDGSRHIYVKDSKLLCKYLELLEKTCLLHGFLSS